MAYDVENGRAVEPVDEIIRASETVQLPPLPMMRLRRLQAEAQGAAAAAQAAIDVANQAQQRLQVALTEACEDQGFHLPPNQNRPVDVDWMTGKVTFK